jgi:membrane protein
MGGMSGTVVQVLQVGLSLSVISALFAIVFKVLPDAKVQWRDVWIGAALTALLFNVGRILIGVYLGHSSVSESYGAAGSLVAIIVWVYYSANILFLGAEFTQAYARKHGSRIVPDEHAVAAPSESSRKPRTERDVKEREERVFPPGRPRSA